jgi:uncharacterized protein
MARRAPAALARAFGAGYAAAMGEMIEAIVAAPLFWAVSGVTLVAGLVRGFAGFGSAMLMAPVFASLIGPAEAVITVVLVEMLVSVQLFPPARRLCEWRLVGPMAAAACLAMPAGAWLLRTADPRSLVVGVSAIVIVFVLVLASGWRYRGRQGRAGAMAVGAVSGAMMATTSVGGPPVLLVLLAGTSPPEVQRANIIVYYFLTQFLLLAVVGVMRPVAASVWLGAALLVVPMLAGSWIGQRLFRAADAALYRKAALAILFAAGAFGLARGLFTSA